MLWSFRKTNRVPNPFPWNLLSLTNLHLYYLYIYLTTPLYSWGYTRIVGVHVWPIGSELREHRLHVCPACMLIPLPATASRTQDWLKNNTRSLQSRDFSLPDRVLWHEWRMMEVGDKNRGKGLMRVGDRGQEGTLEEQARRSTKSKQSLVTKGLIR